MSTVWLHTNPDGEVVGPLRDPVAHNVGDQKAGDARVGVPGEGHVLRDGAEGQMCL